MKNLLALVVASVGLIAASAIADDSKSIRDALSGTWVAWDIENNSAARSGLTSLTFLFQGTDGLERNVVTWETVANGKHAVRTGTFNLEKSANLVHPSSTTWCVMIRGIGPGYAPDAAIHLVNLRVDRDNRFPSTEVILKCRDAFYTEFLFRRNTKDGQPSAAGNRGPRPGSKATRSARGA